ncbi:hypothetical protein FVEG_15795 [Fusarium verticillioides 7600]|uniref:Uncharacterized protein n=1 Tax=Gibberella moniliformis (strain M3125 / FGSC 7600) TaxID=334819 RepID=W7MC07_GIBM7|nr:hypothetical protein FVEG_15795 [Fusarium verticillioides 7600]EWG45109.1 hypothetical protein FVEG_15795 [Fusarium verticillioides 7600]
MTRKKSDQGYSRVSNWLCLDLHRTLGSYNPLGCDFSLFFFIIWFIGALQLWLAYQSDLSRSALSHQSASHPFRSLVMGLHFTPPSETQERHPAASVQVVPLRLV